MFCEYFQGLWFHYFLDHPFNEKIFPNTSCLILKVPRPAVCKYVNLQLFFFFIFGLFITELVELTLV